jgi:hypothetical protein
VRQLSSCGPPGTSRHDQSTIGSSAEVSGMTAIIGAITFLLISDRTVPAASPEVSQSSEAPPDDPESKWTTG